MRTLSFLAGSFLLLGLAAPAMAQPSHLCAGIAESGRDIPGADGFSLKLVYAEPGGAYLGNVTTRIADADGQVVVEAHCEGPWLLASLPAGSYEVTASFEGETKTQSVSVGEQGQTEQVIRF